MKKIYPHIKIFGVETHDANGMTVSLKEGRPVTLDKVGLFADGAAVRSGTLFLFDLNSSHSASRPRDIPYLQ